MKPVSPVLPNFAEHEVVFAKDQADYLPLPALPIGDPRYGTIITRWKMTWRERIVALFRGSVFLQVMTFGKPLQPVALYVDPPQENDGTEKAV